MNAAPAPLLQISNIEVVYDRVILVLKGLSFEVPEGGMVALLGANGAGKTTTMRAISNLLKGERGDMVAGSIKFLGERIDALGPEAVVKKGILQVMEGRRCFSHLSVEENLLTGAHVRSTARGDLSRSLERVYDFFPRLKTRRRSAAGLLSGGEQQMCAIGRALMANPKIILLDEPSMGLAPQLVDEIFAMVSRLNREEGVGIVLAEQNATVALRHASHAYVVENGKIVLGGSAEQLRHDSQVKAFYLGLGDQGRLSFRNSKTYRRRPARLM